MSVAHIAWAMEQTTGSPSRKSVLVALADYANGTTGRCCPHIDKIAAKTELSEPTVKRALVDLVAAGLIQRERQHRLDGKQAGYDYRLPIVRTVAEPEIAVTPGPEITVIPHEPGTSLEPTTPPVVPPSNDLVTVDRKRVTESEAISAIEALDEWNRQTGQSLKSRDWRAKIVMRQREHPDLTVIDHAAIIAAALADPWWTGPPSPSVVYGNGAQFERCIEAAKRAASGAPVQEKPGRYGRGLTTRQILDLGRSRDAERTGR